MGRRQIVYYAGAMLEMKIMNYGFRLLNVAPLVALFTIVFIFVSTTARSGEICSQAKYDFYKHSLPCQMEIISWVEIKIQGKLLEARKSDYEKLVRLRLRNDLSMIKHETQKYFDLFNKYDAEIISSKLRERGELFCFVWTVGDDFPVASYVECTLRGYGQYAWKKEYSHRFLAYFHSRRADEEVRGIIRDIIAEISADFLEDRDKLNQ